VIVRVGRELSSSHRKVALSADEFFFSFLVSSAALTSLEFFICNTIEAVPVTMAVVIQRVPENMTLQRRRNKLGGRRVYIIHLHQGRRREFPLDAL
jgi:hypothetical protein